MGKLRNYAKNSMISLLIKEGFKVMISKPNYYCRVCGLIQDDPPWGNDNNTPSFNICSCCGVEFGYEDATLNAIKNYRTTWLANGSEWFETKDKPIEWLLENQLKNIPNEYL